MSRYFHLCSAQRRIISPQPIDPDPFEPIVCGREKRNRDMDAAELRAIQAPIKERYKNDPKAGLIT
ncbi:MAG: hypothetical protein WBW67_26350, partial [Pseudolabrys sp.]